MIFKIFVLKNKNLFLFYLIKKKNVKLANVHKIYIDHQTITTCLKLTFCERRCNL